MNCTVLYKVNRHESDLSLKTIDLCPPNAEYDAVMNRILHVFNENLEDIEESHAAYVFVEILGSVMTVTGCMPNGTQADLMIAARVD